MSNSYKQLTAELRYKIDALMKAGISKTIIANQLGVHRSTIYREISRNSTKNVLYSGKLADMYSQERKERFGVNRKFNDSIKGVIIKKLTLEQWSPEQIEGWCSTQNIEMVSTERIYQFIRQDKASGGTLYKHLRCGGKSYRKPYGSSAKALSIKDRVSIDKRPEIINNKQRYGDWEIDTIIGKNQKGAIVTIVERKSGFMLMDKLEGKFAHKLTKKVVRLLAPYKEQVHSITSDNGTEFADHKSISKKLNSAFYFAHPYSSWERGLNEYTNKLVRQYITKGSSFDNVNQQTINNITMKLNTRPRKKLNYKTPLNVFLTTFNQNVALGT